MKKTIKIIFLILLLLILGSLITIKTTNLIDNKKLFDKHKNYLELDKKDQQIQEWMTLQFISKNFKIDKKELQNILPNTQIKFKDKKKSLSQYCENNEIDCKVLIKNINEIKK
jgi:uncharacterized protein YxeA